MDSDLLKAVVAGISSALTTLAVVPLLVKGKIRHERELVAEQEAAQIKDAIRLEQIAERDAENDRLLAANAKLDTDYREQMKAMLAQQLEVTNAIKVIEGMSRLAAQERRSSGDD
jgi:hypothetical protein